MLRAQTLGPLTRVTQTGETPLARSLMAELELTLLGDRGQALVEKMKQNCNNGRRGRGPGCGGYGIGGLGYC